MNRAWTRTTLGQALVSELNVDALAADGTSVPDAVANAVAESFDWLWAARPFMFRRRRATLTWKADKDVLRTPSTWTGTSTPTLAGAHTGSAVDCYTFTVSAAGTVGAGTVTLTVTDFEGDAVATLSIGTGYTAGTAQTVANGITIAMSAGTVSLAQTFYVDLTHDTAITPIWAQPGGTDLSDFGKLETDWLQENNDNGDIEFTTDVAKFEAYRHALRSATGTPEIVLIEPVAGLTRTLAWQAHAAPAPDAEVDYEMVYMNVAPTLGLTQAPPWPPFMHALWRVDAKWRIQQALQRETWKATYGAMKAMLDTASDENDETQENNVPLIHDGYGDMGFLASR